MAKITVTIDTETKIIDANIDGIEYSGIDSVSAYKYRDYYENEDELSVSLCKTMKGDNGVSVNTTVYAHKFDGQTKGEKDVENIFRRRFIK